MRNLIIVVTISSLLLGSCGRLNKADNQVDSKEQSVSNSKYESSNASAENEKSEVRIGNQVWMTKNLNVDRFQNGDLIPEVKSDEEWIKAFQNKTPAWCYNNNDPSYGKKYGKLYNNYALTDKRGIAPVGWHIPSSDEINILVDYLGGENFAGAKLCSKDWPDISCATNSSGFSGLPGGSRSESGNFEAYEKGHYYGNWWTCSKSSFTNSSVHFILGVGDGSIQISESMNGAGYSVRCIKD